MRSVNRGDVFRLPAARGARGHEQRGTRYAVVLQADELSALSTVLVAPTSTAAQPASFRPEVRIGKTKTRLMIEQSRAVDPQRLGKRAGRLAWEEMEAADSALRLVLAL